jgi:AcrR family transcriptional regulator
MVVGMPPPTRVVPRQERSAASVEQLVAAAERVIDRVGATATTTALVAAEAGVSIGRVYYWFPDASSLVTEVADRAATRLESALGDVAEEVRWVPVELALRRVVEELSAAIWTHPGLADLLRPGRAGALAADGGRLRAAVSHVVERAVVGRARTVPVADRPLVTAVVVEIVAALVTASLRADPAVGLRLEHELQRAIGAYLALSSA